MPIGNVPPRWTRTSSERSCYDLNFDQDTEMCDNCHYFSERMTGLEKKPRKGTTPKCERVKLMKNDSSLARKKINKLCFNEILVSKGCINNEKLNLGLSRHYLLPTPLKVRLVINRIYSFEILTTLLPCRNQLLVLPKNKSAITKLMRRKEQRNIHQPPPKPKKKTHLQRLVRAPPPLTLLVPPNKSVITKRMMQKNSTKPHPNLPQPLPNLF